MEIFTKDFMLTAMAAGALTAVVCCFLGVYVVLRRVVFVGVSLAQVSSAGVALGMLIGISPLLSSTALTALTVLIVAFHIAGRRVSRESIIGVIYVAGSASAFLLLAGSAWAEARVMDILFGNILTIERGNLYLSLLVFVPAIVTQLVFFKEFMFTAYDPETAGAFGFKARFWDTLFFVTLGAVVSTATMLVGVLLMFAFLVVPSTTALLVANRLRNVFIISIVLGVTASFGGFCISYYGNLPPGPTISAFACLILIAASAMSWLVRVKKAEKRKGGKES